MKSNKIKKSAANKLKSNKVLLAAGVLVVVLMLTYVSRGWLRVTVMAKVLSFTHARGVGSTAESKLAKLGDPFGRLGYGTPATTHKCRLLAAKGLKASYQCVYELNASQEVSQDKAGKEQFAKDAQTVLTSLEENGWSGEYKGSGKYTSLTALTGNISAGIDYTPDASYQKDIDNIRCWLSSYTAFSRPEPPAISTIMICVRTVNVFGRPDVSPEDYIIYKD